MVSRLAHLTREGACNPSLGRWINRDPLGERASSNLYAYVKNNPAIWIDQLGLGTWEDLKKAMDKICDNPDCVPPEQSAKCKADATGIVNAMQSMWNNNFGHGPYNGGDSQGGYACWDWASGFISAANSPPCQVSVDDGFFAPGQGGQMIHPPGWGAPPGWTENLGKPLPPGTTPLYL